MTIWEVLQNLGNCGILQNLGIFAILVSGLAWLARSLTKQVLDRDLERFKADLEKDAVSYKIRYERLHTEKFEVIKEVYNRIVKFDESLRSLIHPFQWSGEPTTEEKEKTVRAHHGELTNYYQENRIFFEEQLAKEIDSLLNESRDIWYKFQESQMARQDGEHKEAHKQWIEAWKQFRKKVPSPKQKLENRFRESLGIENN